MSSSKSPAEDHNHPINNNNNNQPAPSAAAPSSRVGGIDNESYRRGSRPSSRRGQRGEGDGGGSSRGGREDGMSRGGGGGRGRGRGGGERGAGANANSGTSGLDRGSGSASSRRSTGGRGSESTAAAVPAVTPSSSSTTVSTTSSSSEIESKNAAKSSNQASTEAKAVTSSYSTKGKGNSSNSNIVNSNNRTDHHSNKNNNSSQRRRDGARAKQDAAEAESNRRKDEILAAEQAAAAAALAAEQAKARIAAEAAAAQAAEVKAEEKRRKKAADALASRVNEAKEIVQNFVELALKHKSYRMELEPAALERSRIDFDAEKKKLKTDLKKCTAFVKKVKSGSAWTSKIDDILKDVKSLNLSRYVEEVAMGIMESKPKVTDLPTIVALSVAMHERYPEFLPVLLPIIVDAVGGNGEGEAAKYKRLCLRILTEFILTGIVTDTKTLLKCVAESAGAPKEGSHSTSYCVQDGNLVVAFTRAAGSEILGTVPKVVRQAIDVFHVEQARINQVAETENTSIVLAPTDIVDDGIALSQQVDILASERAVTSEVADIFVKHCLGAYRYLSTSLVQTNTRLQKLERRCEQDRLLAGTLPEAREKGLQDARKLKENLYKSVEFMADALDLEVPILLDNSDAGGVETGAGVEVWTKTTTDVDEDLGPFDDEETRDFYCDIPDLLATIPPVLLGLNPEQVQKQKEENLRKYGKDSEPDTGKSDASLEVPPVSEAELDAKEKDRKLEEFDVDDDCDEEDADKKSSRYRLVALIDEELPECNRREQVDELMEKLCTNYGSSKNARKRLLSALLLVPRNRFDLLPFYSRVAATADRIWSDFASTLVIDLEQQFHGQAKYKKNLNLDSRFKTARYIGELTKFRVAPPIVFLRCIRRCLDDFTGGNIDVACCLLESCGRFLFRLSHSSSRVSDIMDAMTRLSKAKNLDERSQSLIKSAFYNVKPPQGTKRIVKEYSPLETYLRQLLIERLVPTASFVSFTSKQIVRLPWSIAAQQCGDLVTRLMLKACRRGRYRTIQAIASVAAALRGQRMAGEVTVRLVDAVLEELQWALENPIFRDQQRVITYARLLGELYDVNLVSGQLIIRQLYDFINMGHEIPDPLREASKKLSVSSEDGELKPSCHLPVYNSATGVSQTIMEDEEMEDDVLETKAETPAPEPLKPVAVSEYSKYDPRVLSPTDPPNSAYRIKLVCTLLDVVAKSIVTRNSMRQLKVFLTAFQRYLFTKSMLPTDVEFSLLDTFDVLDSHWKQVCKNKKAIVGEDGFPRYTSWLDAHNATIEFEEMDALASQKAEMHDASDARSATYSLDGRSAQDDDTMTNFDEDDENTQSTESDDENLDENIEIVAPPDAEMVAADHVNDGGTIGDEGSDVNYDESDASESISGDGDDDDDADDFEDDEEEEFNEEAYMRQLEAEAFEFELRRMTKDAIERGKSTSRKLVADYMPSGAQISKKKGPDPTPAESFEVPPSMFALGGKEGVSLKVLKKGNKGKFEAVEVVVPKDTSLAAAATRNDDEAARERDVIKQRVLQYEADSAYAEASGGNVYLEQEKLQVIRNRPLSMDVIDRNFGTKGGNLRQGDVEKSVPSQSISGASTTASANAGRRSGRGGRDGYGHGRGRGSGGRILFS